MLSYQHEFHAGGAADVFKHTALCLILDALRGKQKPFTIIDTHASSGVFHLDDPRLLKTGEAARGIKPLFALYNSGSSVIPQGVKLYLDTQRPYVETRRYAGSPELELLFSRKGDTLFFIEKHPQALAALRDNIGKRHSFIRGGDSFDELFSLIPPLVRRGLVFIDPSFEDEREWQKVAAAFESVRRKWNTAIVAVWYPLLARQQGNAAVLVHSLETSCKTGKVPCAFLNAELVTARTSDHEGASHLLGCGVFVANPPWRMQERLDECRTFLQRFFTHGS